MEMEKIFSLNVFSVIKSTGKLQLLYRNEETLGKYFNKFLGKIIKIVLKNIDKD